MAAAPCPVKALMHNRCIDPINHELAPAYACTHAHIRNSIYELRICFLIEFRDRDLCSAAGINFRLGQRVLSDSLYRRPC